MPGGLTSTPAAAPTASPLTGPLGQTRLCRPGPVAVWPGDLRAGHVLAVRRASGGELAGPRHRVRDGPAGLAARLHAEVDLADRPSLGSADPEPALLRPRAGRGARRELPARLLEPPAVQSRALRGILASPPRNRAGSSPAEFGTGRPATRRPCPAREEEKDEMMTKTAALMVRPPLDGGPQRMAA